MVREHDPRDPGEAGAPTRRLPRRVADGGGRHERRPAVHAGRRADEQHAPQLGSAENERDRHADGEEGDEAGLRVGEEQARPQEGDQRRSHPEADPPKPDRDEQDGDRDDDVPSEDTRVLEERGDAKVRRVGVGPRDVSREQVAVREALEERHAGEQHGKPDERCGERARMPPAKRRAHHSHDERREREQEEEQLDRPLPEVLRPQQRDPPEQEERRRRKGKDPRERPPDVAAKRADDEREQRRGEDDVQRYQQICLLRADARRDPERRRGEQDDRHELGIAG